MGNSVTWARELSHPASPPATQDKEGSARPWEHDLRQANKEDHDPRQKLKNKELK